MAENSLPNTEYSAPLPRIKKCKIAKKKSRKVMHNKYRIKYPCIPIGNKKH